MTEASDPPPKGTRRRRGAEARAALGHVQPKTYEELRAVLASGTVSFPPRLRQVAIFLWQHPTDVALGSIIKVARQAGVQPSTLVRFAQSFGYAGFSDFQDLFKEHLKGVRPDAEAIAATASEDLRFLTGLVGAAQASLGRIAEGIDAAGLEAMITAMAGADFLYLVGSKRAFPVAAYLSLTLSQMGVRNLLIDNVGSSAPDQMACVGPGDAVLAISFSPYNSITPDLVAAAHGRGAVVLTITDSALSPLVPLSAHWLEVVEQDFAGVRPLAASLAVGMALVHGLAARRK